MSDIITRFPPSPTGYFHIGSARTALFNYLFAAHGGGRMILRFEDTDRERSKREFEDDILEGLKWLGLSYDKPEPLRQSERTAVYQKHLDALIETGAAYEAEDAKDESGKKVIRFKNPNADISFEDLVRGTVSFNTADLGDFVIAKSRTEPLYHLAVVVDDHEMGVTHVIRGEDHISNTPRQILIIEALSFARPQYAHIPLILAPDRTKLSKRHGAVSVNEYRAQGFIPEALVNYLALLGWNPGGEREIYALHELADAFSIEHIHKGGAIFDIEKLKWFNHEHLKALSDEEFEKRLREFMEEQAPAEIGKLVPLLKERAQTLEDAAQALTSGEYDFLGKSVSVSADLLLKGAKTDAEEAKAHLSAVAEMLENLSDEDFTAEGTKETLFPYATEKGRASVLWPLRVALSGKERSPDPFTLLALLGKETSLSRIAEAAQKL